MQHLEEGTIHAWIDGELSAEKGAEIEAHAASCAACAAMIAEARGLVAASSRIAGALDATPGGVIPAFGRPRRPRPWRVGASVSALIAATVIVAIGMKSSFAHRTPTLTERAVGKVAKSALPPALVTARKPVPVDSVVSGPGLERRADRVASAPPPKAVDAVIAPANPSAAAATAGVGVGVLSGAAVVASANATQPDTQRASLAPIRSGFGGGGGRGGRASRLQDVVVTSADLRSASDSAAKIAADSSAQSRADAARKVGALALGSGIATPAPAMASAFAGSARAVGLVGCYEVDRSTDVLPKRFELRVDRAGTRDVRYVDSTGVADGRIADVSWVEEAGLAIVRATNAGAVLTIARSGDSLIAQSRFGTRTIRPIPCR